MFKNYFIVALRQLKQNAGFTLLNVFGLALGLTCSLLILLWIQDELSYDKFHKKYETVYQVLGNQTYDGKTFTFPSTPGLLAESLKAEVPEIKNTTRVDWGNRWLFTKDEKPIFKNGNYVDLSFFDIFSFDFVYGNAKTAFPHDHSIVITKTMSENIFGTINPIGKYIKVNNNEDFLITAVIQDPPSNSSIKFDWLVSYKLFEKENPWYLQWTSNGMRTYAELKPDVDIDKLNQKIKLFVKNKNKEASAMPLVLPMKDWRLKSNFKDGRQDGGRIGYVKLFGVIASLLIIIACINFMNLATARAQKRSKEVGVRKVMGAQRRSLIQQFIGESITMAFLAVLVACIFVLMALPFFNTLVEKQLSLHLNDPNQWFILFGLILFCGILSGSYPSVYLSSFKPVSLFKGLSGGRSSKVVLVRKGLVVTQFVFSIVLIIATIVVYKQIDHVKSRNLGFNMNNLLYMKQIGQINKKLDVIEQDLFNTGVVLNVAACNQRIVQAGNNTSGFDWPGKDQSKELLITTEWVSSDYINTAGMKLHSGRNFYKNSKADTSTCIVNETFAKLIGNKNIINSNLSLYGTNYTIIGVIKDFIFNDMYKTPDPFVMFCQPQGTQNLFVRLNPTVDVEKAINKIETVFKKDNPGYPFEYKFLDEEYNNNFKNEMLVSKLSRLFAILTIVISCIGLFGLAAYTAERRTKEIGIRKVLGATVSNMISLLSKDFLKLVLLAIAIATPLAWYLMNKWLQDYSYRIEIKWWVFALAGASAIVIALLTVSFQAIKAALANPVKSLRTE